MRPSGTGEWSEPQNTAPAGIVFAPVVYSRVAVRANVLWLTYPVKDLRPIADCARYRNRLLFTVTDISTIQIRPERRPVP